MNSKPKDYKILAEIPLGKVPDNISIQEAKITAEIWLKVKIPDAKLIGFEEVFYDHSV